MQTTAPKLETVKPTNYLSIDREIDCYEENLNRLDDLIKRIDGVPCDEKGGENVKCNPSLGDFLNNTPSRLEEMNKRMIGLIEEINHRLF